MIGVSSSRDRQLWNFRVRDLILRVVDVRFDSLGDGKLAISPGVRSTLHLSSCFYLKSLRERCLCLDSLSSARTQISGQSPKSVTSSSLIMSV